MKLSPESFSALAFAILFLVSSCGRHTDNAHGKRVIVLGIDGMDPGFLDRHWDSLPNLRKLRRRGGFQTLATTAPPQSPVAWSTFTTGMPPARHGVFDFVHRNPATYQPFSSMAEVHTPGFSLRFGPYELPLSTAKITSVRRGEPFWRILAEHGIPVTVLRMPANFPPADCEGFTLSGMGVPDLKGTFGTFTYFTNDPLETARDVPGGRIAQISLINGSAFLAVEGPANSLRKDKRVSSLALRVAVDSAARAARFEIAGRLLILKQGEWSEWVPVRFPLAGALYGVSGMLRIYAKELGDTVRIYVSPVNLNPMSPELPISTPSPFSRSLADATGLFYTQGIAEDTAALRQGVFSLDEYLAQARLVSEEHLRLFHQSMKTFRSGFLFFHYFGVDQNSHMLWRKHDDKLLATYELVDREIGALMTSMGDATLIVMSDHGFTSFDRAVHLNSWLRQQGYLVLKNGEADWSRTKAYAIGLNGLYLNLRGREREGTVSLDKADDVMRDLTERLLRFTDPRDGAAIIGSLPRASADGLGGGPDLIVGYNPGFRASWQTALGEAPASLVEDNSDAWIGDHCGDPRHVPGVLLMNRQPGREGNGLADVTATVLKEFGIVPPREMTGVAF